MGLKHCHFFSVCDGHGTFGKEVSGLLKHRLPFIYENNLKVSLADHDFSEYPSSPVIYDTVTTSFAQMNKEVYDIL